MAQLTKVAVGQRYGRLLVVERLAKGKTNKSIWLCRCRCLKFIRVSAKELCRGRTRSCGCFQKDQTAAANTTHGLRGHALYATWRHMLGRCYNAKSISFCYYGGRGIRVCYFLRQSPLGIEAVIGRKPVNNRFYSMDRINNAKNYSCGVCWECRKLGWKRNIRWATQSQQLCNRRPRVS